MLVQCCNPGTWEPKAGGCVNSRPDWAATKGKDRRGQKRCGDQTIAEREAEGKRKWKGRKLYLKS